MQYLIFVNNKKYLGILMLNAELCMIHYYCILNDEGLWIMINYKRCVRKLTPRLVRRPWMTNDIRHPRP